MSIIDNVKEAVKLAHDIENLDLYRKLLDLQSEVLGLTEQVSLKEQRIAELEEASLFKARLICRDSAYFEVGDDDEITDGPFCTKCFDLDQKKCRLIPAINLGNEKVHCQKCKVPFNSSAGIRFLRKRT